MLRGVILHEDFLIRIFSTRDYLFKEAGIHWPWNIFLIGPGLTDPLCDLRKALAGVDQGIDFDWSGYRDQQGSCKSIVNGNTAAQPA